ncbi:hypothetical protein PFLUV_G00039280 [Perca fluviatilis]|uniref:Uncharacterized protein n=1 Tax=Perca fluviatilis TaxID=8168 RepID=A0A6A5FKI9_PERFL|nr:hypothetical protein PFLUV_G00039280 [Perca fluviatilis]
MTASSSLRVLLQPRRIHCVLPRQQQQQQQQQYNNVLVTERRDVYPSGTRGKTWQRQSTCLVRRALGITLSIGVPLRTARSLGRTSRRSPLIKMKKSDQAHAEHQHSGEEKERELWREKEEKERQHRRAEKKMLAFWMSLSHKTRTLFRPRKRPGFQRSTSAVRLLKSEA